VPVSRAPSAPPDLLRTVLSGRVTDRELLDYYMRLMDSAAVPFPWLERVDGTGVTDMAVTPDGQWRLAAFVSQHLDLVRGGRVAMVATSGAVYGMFRMWQMQREDLDYAVQVFREMGEAEAWLWNVEGEASGSPGSG